MSIKLLPFDREAAQKGALLVTRDYREVEFIEFNPKLHESVRVRVHIKGMKAPTTYFSNGYRTLEQNSKYDLFIVTGT
jgi:protein-L-isoaspartate O-methyltransferase